MTTNIATPRSEATRDEKSQISHAHQSLLIFLLFLIPFSLFGYWFNITYPDAPLILPSLPLALSPGLAAIITRLLRREGFADVSFRLRGPKMRSAYLLAFGLPLIVGILAYGLAWLTGLAKFDPPAFPFAVTPPLGQLGVNLLFTTLLGLIILFPTSAGEEIGWRGYLLPRLIDARIPQPVILSSLIWGAWHLPVVFAGVYAVGPSRWITALGLMIATLAFGSIISWIRLQTGSVWPCVISHVAWNSMINGGFTLATASASENMWVGETGILVAVTLVIAAWVIGRSWKPASLSART